MYVLRSELNNVYFYTKKNKIPQIITFETIEEVQNALNLFQNYSIQALAQTGDIFGIGSAMQIATSFKAEELTEKTKEKFSNTIAWSEIAKEKGL